MKFGAEAAGDVGALTLPVFRLDGQVTASDGAVLVGLLGLDRAVNVDKRAGTLNVAVRSAAGSDARVDARLNAGGLTASANGTARLFDARGFATAVDVTLQAADVSPLRRGAITQPPALLPVALRAKLNASAAELALENIAGVVGGSPVRGNLKLGLGTAKRIDGKDKNSRCKCGEKNRRFPRGNRLFGPPHFTRTYTLLVCRLRESAFRSTNPGPIATEFRHRNG